MGAKLGEDIKLSDILKYVGIDCPEDLMEATLADIIAGGTSHGLTYHLYAWKDEDGYILYTEEKVPVPGDVVLMNNNETAITDPAQLTVAKSVSTGNARSISVILESLPVPYLRYEEGDYTEVIQSVRGMVDISSNGTVVSQKHTVFKALGIKVE